MYLENIPELNLGIAMNKAKKKVLNYWKSIFLTSIGRMTLIKTMILSRWNHLFMSIVTPEKKILDDLNRMLFSYLWEGKHTN